jgi:hypothetical protein
MYLGSPTVSFMLCASKNEKSCYLSSEVIVLNSSPINLEMYDCDLEVEGCDYNRREIIFCSTAPSTVKEEPALEILIHVVVYSTKTWSDRSRKRPKK